MSAASSTTYAQAPARRLRELDGIRCLAVFGVMLVHFAPGSATGPWGDWGVKAFFVLSGFLITDGLLALRNRMESGEVTLPAALLDFFRRRALRLWPLYLAVIAVTYGRDLGEAREIIGWNLASASNYLITLRGEWPGIYSHFWTLAVEQHFYLFWPLVVLAVARRLQPAVILVLLVSAPLLRGLEFTHLASSDPSPNHPAGLLLPMCADALAWGALLAQLRRAAPGWSGWAGGWLGLGIFAGLYLLHRFGPGRFEAPWVAALAGTALGAASFLVIAHCTSSQDSLLKRFLRLPPLAYLGMISYGIYVLHNFTHWLGPSLLRRLVGRNYFGTEPAHVLYLMALSVALAALSWHAFERPLIALGRTTRRTPPTAA